MLVVFEPRSGASGDFRSYIMALVGLCSSRLDSSRPLRNRVHDSPLDRQDVHAQQDGEEDKFEGVEGATRLIARKISSRFREA